MKLNMFRATDRHHQEPKTALTASGFAYVRGCWTLWLLAPDDGRSVARNMLSFT